MNAENKARINLFLKIEKICKYAIEQFEKYGDSILDDFCVDVAHRIELDEDGTKHIQINIKDFFAVVDKIEMVNTLTPKEYQKLALRTATNLDKPEELILNGILGLTGEAGECADIVKKYKYQGHPLDAAKLAEKLGDVLWYVAILAEALGTDLSTIMIKNINKLYARYPEGFDAERSIHREEDGYVVVDQKKMPMPPELKKVYDEIYYEDREYPDL